MSIPTLSAVAPATVVSGLQPYTGTWSREQAAHLLRRTLFGPKKSEIQQAISAGLSGTLDQLLANPAPPAPPVNHYYTEDNNVPVGSTWINSPLLGDDDIGAYRYRSLRGWYWQNMMHHDFNIMSRMSMFWVNFFGIGDAGDHRAQFKYIDLFNRIGTDNVQRMIEEVTVQPSMLVFLNGAWSNKWTPNEDYANELLELFTVGLGPQVSEEDYTNYTDVDKVAIARILTGWRVVSMWEGPESSVDSYFDANWHDDEPKQLSYRFGNRIIQPNGDQEYKDLIQVLFEQDATALNICRKLYRFFVFSDITSQVESQVIVPLAQVMRDNNYDIKPTLRALFGSQHFFDMAVRGPMIKNPYEYITSVIRPLGGYSHLGLDLFGNGSLQTRYDLGLSHNWQANNLNMTIFTPPGVGGWPAYSQTPTYYRNWIGSATLKERKTAVDRFTGSGIYTQDDGSGNYSPRPLDYFAFVASLEAPSDPNELVAESAEIFMPRPLEQSQLDVLKNFLIPDLPDSEWSRQYADYLASPFNPDVVNPVRNKLRAFYRALFSMAEFHLM